jgi:hypothetical protein
MINYNVFSLPSSQSCFPLTFAMNNFTALLERQASISISIAPRIKRNICIQILELGPVEKMPDFKCKANFQSIVG